jgi:ERCC4-type nuclease
MPYLIVRTEVRNMSNEAVDATDRARDEWHQPETRRQTVIADSREAALRMARALSACGQVRSGRQRVKVIRLS